MRAYPDTSFLCAMYRPQPNSVEAAKYFAEMTEPLRVTSLLLYEFKQSVRFQAYLHSKDASKGYDGATARLVLAKLQSNIASGAIGVVPVDWADAAGVAERLSANHTRNAGYRAFDILHVATALYLGAVEFLTFDVKQKALAEGEGLIVPL